MGILIERTSPFVQKTIMKEKSFFILSVQNLANYIYICAKTFYSH